MIVFPRNTVLEFATKSNPLQDDDMSERGIPIPILNYLNYLRPLSHANCRFRIRGWGRVLGTYMHINFTLHFTLSHLYLFANVLPFCHEFLFGLVYIFAIMVIYLILRTKTYPPD